MKTIPFDINLRPEIVSGKYKVQTITGKPATILKWDLKNSEYCLLGYLEFKEQEEGWLWDITGKAYTDNKTSDFDLVLIDTQEPELTDFEREFKAIVEDDFGAVTPVSDTDVRKACEKLSTLVCKDCPSRGNTHAYLQGKRDALNDLPKWKKVETNAFYPDIAYSDKGKCPMLHYGEYEINIVKLKKALPKEEE